MPRTGGVVGAVQLDDDLYWVTQFQDVAVASKKHTVGGSIVITKMRFKAGPYTDQEHTFRFTWATSFQVALIRKYFITSTAIPLQISSLSNAFPNAIPVPGTLKIIPVVGDDFMSNDAVHGTPLDLYNGEMNFILRASELQAFFGG